MNIFDIRNYEGNIQEAVKDCAESGGGTVLIPAGRWESGKIHLHSHVHLHLEEEAVISFSDKPEDYLPVVFTRWEGTECYNYSPLIYACDCEDIAITGSGTLMGNGQAWWHWKNLQQTAAEELGYADLRGVPVGDRRYGTVRAALRPSFFQPINCKQILVEGVTMIDGPQWTIHPVYCEAVTVRNVKVFTHGPNTDGLNPDSCQNVLIEGSTFDTGDDCIAINSGMNEDGWRVGRPCKNIEIRNCTMKGGHSGIAIGSALSGGVEHIYVHDCNISGTMQGIRIKSMQGRGGYVRDTSFDNIVIDGALEHAIQITMFYEYSTIMPKSQEPSDFEHIAVKNITGSSNRTGIEIKGLPEKKLKNIKLEHISLTAPEAFICSDVENMEADNVTILSEEAIGYDKTI